MEKEFQIIKLNREMVSDELFKQIVAVEQAEGTDNCYSESQLREIYINDEKNVNFVCLDGNKVVAHIATNPKSKRRNGSIFIINLVVDPRYRKRGIAQNLIYTASKFYLDYGYSLPVSITVDKDNTPAINLYKKVGFKIVEPICEIDEDDEQFILESMLFNLTTTIRELDNANLVKDK